MWVWICHHCVFIHLLVHISVNFPPVFVHISVCACVDDLSFFILYHLLVNKEEVVQKARPVSSDVGNANPNFSDLMDEFIQERLRAKGTAVSSIHQS